MVEEGLPIYKVKVQGQERKAIDLEALNSWLDNQIVANNPLASDTSKLPDGTTLEQYKGLVGWGMTNELSFEVKNALGLIKKPEVEGVVESEPEPEPKLESKPEPKKKEPEPEVEPKTVEVKEPEVIEPGNDDEDVVVLQ